MSGVSGPWSQYAGYGSYQAQPAYPTQGPQATQAGYPAQNNPSAQGAYAAQAGYPIQASNYYAGSGYAAQGFYSQPQQPQQYAQSYYPQQQYGPAQANYNQTYAPQMYPPHVSQQTTFQQNPQYQQPQPMQQHQQQAAMQPQPAQQPNQQAQDTKHKLARPSLSTCYNCGSLDHWAMDCPEPKRANPHGAMIENKNQQKQKHKPVIITRYHVPPHVAAQHGTPTTPYSNSNPNPSGFYPQTAQANQYPQQQWQGVQPPQTPYTPGSYQFNNVPGYGQQQHGLPTPRNSLSHVSNPQSSPKTPLHTPGKSSQPYGLHSQSPNAPTPPTSLYSAPQAAQTASHARQSSINSSRRPSMDQSVSMQSASEDDEEDDLQLLDIPDLPQNFNSESCPKPMRVGKPIRAVDSRDSGVSSPVHEIASESRDSIVSKYFETRNVDDLLTDISRTDEFAKWEQDPIFAVIETLPQEHLASNESRSHSSESDRVFSITQTSASKDTSASNEDDGNNTPVYRQEPSLSPRVKDAFDLDEDDFYPEEAKANPLPVRVSGQLPGLDYANHPPPPPPPPPRRKPSGYANGSAQHVSPGHNPTRTPGHFSNGIGRSGSQNGLHVSPGANSSDRKRKVEAADFMDSPERDRKRQEEDYIPKHKRNQPKVAEAYSRRW